VDAAGLEADLRFLILVSTFAFSPVLHAQDPGTTAAQQAAQQQAMVQQVQQAQQQAQQAQQQMQQAQQQAMQQALAQQQTSPPTGSPYGRADKPEFVPPAGKYSSAVTVSLRERDPKASIYYTTDGSLPTTASSLYTGPFIVKSTTVVRAMARTPIYAPSKTVKARYIVR
jgi:type II secretory pathway pseudopilin PulG